MHVNSRFANVCPPHAPNTKKMKKAATDTLARLHDRNMVCAGLTMDNACLSLKLFRTGIVRVLMDTKGWSEHAVPKKLINLMQAIPHVRELMQQITPACKYDFGMDYGRMEVCVAAYRIYKYDDDRCALCGAQAEKLKKCCGCKLVWYCGAACQKAHWQSKHKEECKSMVDVVSDGNSTMAMTSADDAMRVMCA